jgi:hypothetical protein
LQIDLDLDFVSGDDDAAGHLVFKQLQDNVFERGPVVEAIIAASAQVEITSTNPDTSGPETLHQGTVTIDFVSDPGGRELNVQLVRLDGVTEEFPEEVQALGFQPGRISSYRGKLNVPAEGTPASPQVRMRFRIMGRTAGTLPSLSLTMRRIPSATIGSPAALPTSDTAVTIGTSFAIAAANEYADVTSDPFVVEAGDTVIFELKRIVDVYVGEVDVLQNVGILEST